MKRIIMFCGTSATGKTTVAKTLEAQGFGTHIKAPTREGYAVYGMTSQAQSKELDAEVQQEFQAFLGRKYMDSVEAALTQAYSQAGLQDKHLIFERSPLDYLTYQAASTDFFQDEHLAGWTQHFLTKFSPLIVYFPFSTSLMGTKRAADGFRDVKDVEFNLRWDGALKDRLAFLSHQAQVVKAPLMVGPADYCARTLTGLINRALSGTANLPTGAAVLHGTKQICLAF